jgi:3-methylfumaryl-CoA hydratase
MTAVDIDHLRTWVGREQRVTDPLTPFPARALAAMLDHSKLPDAGGPLPPTWHWLYFLEIPTTAGTGTDGHPAKGGFLPPVPLPRRMWAAASLDIVRPLYLGVPAEKTSRIRSVELKSGKSGPLVFVGIDHHLHQNGFLCVREEQTLVYRTIPNEPAAFPPGVLAPVDADWSRTMLPNPVLLFRFSALTYNSHRIHYDRDYATREEFYPGLVVHAPLLATLLLDLALEQLPVDPAVVQFQFRAVRPTFDSGPMQLCGKREGRQVTLWSAGHDHYVGMSARAMLGEYP